MAIPNLKDIKNWSPLVEKDIVEAWKNSENFKFNEKAKKIYAIDTPPPYVNTPIHIGHAITYCYMDFFARFKRMKGFEVVFPLGLDNNGLPIEMAVEKKYNISPFHVGRDKFIDQCKKLLEEAGMESLDSFAKLGISFTSYKQSSDIGSVYKTDSPEYRALTQSTFIELYKKGLIYEDLRINNWDPKLQTTIADAEIEYKDIPSTFNDIAWTVKETGEKIVIGTTRPELIPSCGMVIYNPEDGRYKHLEGKTAVAPLFTGIEVKIKANSLAEIDKGTGLVMMCSAGDLSDIQFFREQNLKPIISISGNGKMNSNAQFLEGLKVKDARAKLIEMLKEKNLLIKQNQITHRTPVSERSGAEIEFIQMPEFYLKQIEFKDDLRAISKKITFYPAQSKKILDDWIDSVSIDWPISRRRFYATEIPLWHAEHNGKKYVAIPTEKTYYKPWQESVPKNAEVWSDGRNTGKKVSEFNFDWTGETRVLDTWMDSSISELFILKYKTNDEFFKKAYPATLRPQGKEIVRTWLYYTILRGYLETKKPCFEDVWIHQHIVDEKGEKMSKSKGNGINPQDLLRDYGAEALRFWAAIEGDLSKQDLRCSRERINGEVKTINKLLNVSKFILQFGEAKKPAKLCSLDEVFIKHINYLTQKAEKNYEEYDFFHPALELRKFLWDYLASNYLEIVKNRAYNQENNFSEEESNSAKYTLYFLIRRLLTLVYPIIPQVSSVVAKDFGLNLLNEKWPEVSKELNDETTKIEQIINFNSEVWKIKREKQLALNKEVTGIVVPDQLKEFEKDLIACHKIVN